MRRLLLVTLGVGLTVTVTACGEETQELTVHQQLEKVAGRSLTPAEVDDQLQLAELLCGTDGRVLEEVWVRLDTQQLEFQDWVFGQHCPDRIAAYERMRGELGTTSNTTTPTTAPETTTSTVTTGSTTTTVAPVSPSAVNEFE